MSEYKTIKETCISCGCSVDDNYHGHHSAADCKILKYAEEAAEEARIEAAERAVEWVISKGGYPYDERYEFDIDPRTFEDELRAAIFKEATE